MKRIVAILCLCAMLLLPGCAQMAAEAEEPEITMTYEVVGTENTQMWVLKPEEFLETLNAGLEDRLQLDFLEEYDDSSLSCRFTGDGESWKISADIFPADEVGKFYYNDYEDVESWAYDIQELELSTYADTEQQAKDNGIYIRALIHMFTPGVEELVEDVLGLYGDPDPAAVIGEGVTRATIGNVAYTYIPNQKRFYVEPHDETVGIIEEQPTVIRPE